MTYLNRIVDEGKIKRRKKVKEIRNSEIKEKKNSLINEGYISIGELALSYNFSESTIRRWMTDGKISFEKVGNERYINKGEFTKFIKMHNPKPRIKKEERAE